MHCRPDESQMGKALNRRLVGALILSLTAILSLPCVAESALDGTWIHNKKLSDNIKDAFDGQLKRSSYPTPGINIRPGERKNDRDIAQENYWGQVREVRERRSARNLRRLGSCYPLLTAEKLAIDFNAADNSFKFEYDDLLPRDVIPNPNGRIYSAKGDELVADSIGHTLTYWDKDVLVLETDAPEGGKYIERLALVGQPAKLEYSIKLVLRVLKETITVKRIYER